MLLPGFNADSRGGMPGFERKRPLAALKASRLPGEMAITGEGWRQAQEGLEACRIFCRGAIAASQPFENSGSVALRATHA